MSDYCKPHEFQPKPDEACPYCVANRAFEEAKRANARERPAFMAGLEAAFEWDGVETLDYEQAWQQYRCQDDADWRSVQQRQTQESI